MAEQMSFIEEREKDPTVQAVEKICKDAASECAEELIAMALGRIEIDKDRRLALMNVIEIAIGTKFRLRGRPTKPSSSFYKDLLGSNDIGLET